MSLYIGKFNLTNPKVFSTKAKMAVKINKAVILVQNQRFHLLKWVFILHLSFFFFRLFESAFYIQVILHNLPF